MWRCVSFWVEADSFACLRLNGFVRFWVEANSFTDWDWGETLPFELKQIRLLIEYVWMRSLLSRSRFVCWLRLRGFVTFWVEANSFPDWVCGDAFPYKLIQFRFLNEYVKMRSLLSRSRFVSCLRLSGFVRFWVEANSFTDWDWGDSLHFEWLPIRFLIEKWGCVCFWVEANSFTDWVCGDAFPFE